MWIVPKNLHTSHFALDTAALTLDYNALSELCAQSLLVRSSPTLARTWLRKWKQDSWTQHLFGRILKPSHGASFAEKWTSCQVASLVSPSAPLAPAEETRTPDTCSPTFSEDSENWADLPLFSSKMLKESLAPSSQAGFRSRDVQGHPEPTVGGDADGSACGLDYAQLCVSRDSLVDELRLLGNGVVPATAERAFRVLWAQLHAP